MVIVNRDDAFVKRAGRGSIATHTFVQFMQIAVQGMVNAEMTHVFATLDSVATTVPESQPPVLILARGTGHASTLSALAIADFLVLIVVWLMVQHCVQETAPVMDSVILLWKSLIAFAHLNIGLEMLVILKNLGVPLP